MTTKTCKLIVAPRSIYIIYIIKVHIFYEFALDPLHIHTHSLTITRLYYIALLRCGRPNVLFSVNGG